MEGLRLQYEVVVICVVFASSRREKSEFHGA